MPVTQIDGDDYKGLSTDEKPTGELVLENALFLELDTGDFYYYTKGGGWSKVGGE